MWSIVSYALPLAFGTVVSATSKFDYRPSEPASGRNGDPDTQPWCSKWEQLHGPSFVVKLPCLGCPSLPDRSWQENFEDESLLLNFTTHESDIILLNGHPAYDIAAQPPDINALQIPSSTSNQLFDAMMENHMIGSNQDVLDGHKYPRFELQYEHRVFAEKGSPSSEWLQFDVTAIHRRFTQHAGSYALDRDGQMLVQVLIHQEPTENGVSVRIERVQLVDRKDRLMPQKMKCGRYPMIRTEYNPTEWDDYGKIGSWSRTSRIVLLELSDFFTSNARVLVALFAIIGLVKVFRWCRRRREEELMELTDEEAAFLIVELEAPPEYEPPEYLPTEEGKEEGK